MKNVIFDFGQVLVRFDPEYMTAEYVSDADDVRLVSEVLFDRLYWDRLDDGSISDEEVIADAKKRLPERLWNSAEKVYYNWIYQIPEIDGMREIIERLRKKGVGIYLISNISRYFAAHEREVPILSLVDGCVYSSVCGMTKPDPAIFLHACEKFGLSAEDCFFVDDREENASAARSVGMGAYCFKNDADELWSVLSQWLNSRKG